MLRRPVSVALAAVTAAAVIAPAWAFAAHADRAAAPSSAPPAAIVSPEGVRIDDALADRLRATPADGLLRVFVHGADAGAARAAATRAGLRTVFSLDKVGVVAADGVPAAIRRVTHDRAASYVEADAPISFDLDHTHEATRGEEARRIFQQIPAPTKKKAKKNDKASSKKGFVPAFADEIDGRGVGVAIIDSGVDGSHPFFARPDGSSQVVRNLRQTCEEAELLAATEGVCAAAGIDGVFVEAPNNDSDTMANGGHGTHVAGIVGGVDVTTADGRKLHGAAPGADIVALGVGRTLVISGAVPALEWVLEHHADPCGDQSCAPIRVINNSWSADHDYVADAVINKLQRQLIAEGVTVVWAASNDGGDGTEKLTNGYGQEPTPGSIMVANYDDQNTGARDGSLDPSSSRGLQGAVDTYPDISAPGTLVLSSCRAYLPVCSTGLEVVDNGNYNSISGTSMAAPHIAGIVAQLVQVDPTLTPGEIEDILEDTALRITAGGPYEPDLDSRNAGSLTSFDKGHGLVDVVEAVARILGVTAPAAASKCAATGPVLTDPAGDATSAVVVGGLPNEPSLDVTSLTLSTDATDLTAAITVASLGESTSPTAGEGEYFDVNFTHAGRDFYLSAQRDTTGAESYDLGYYGTTGREGGAPATGTFDPATSTITIHLPLAATADPAANIPALADGTVLTGIEVVSRRVLGVVIPDSDHAPAPCAYTIGLGNGTPPPPTTDPGTGTGGEPPAADGTIGPGGTYSFSGSVTTGVAEPTGLGSIVGLDSVVLEGEATVSKVVQLTSGGHLKVELSADQPSDFDLEVLDAAGNEVGSSGGITADELVEADVPAGSYRIIVRLATAYGATFTATAGLS